MEKQLSLRFMSWKNSLLCVLLTENDECDFIYWNKLFVTLGIIRYFSSLRIWLINPVPFDPWIRIRDKLFFPNLGSRIPDTGYWIPDPGSRILYPRSWIPYPTHRFLRAVSFVKFIATKKGTITYLIFYPLFLLLLDPSRMEKSQDPGFGINIPDAQHYYFRINIFFHWKNCTVHWGSFRFLLIMLISRMFFSRILIYFISHWVG